MNVFSFHTIAYIQYTCLCLLRGFTKARRWCQYLGLLSSSLWICNGTCMLSLRQSSGSIFIPPPLHVLIVTICQCPSFLWWHVFHHSAHVSVIIFTEPGEIAQWERAQCKHEDLSSVTSTHATPAMGRRTHREREREIPSSLASQTISIREF